MKLKIIAPASILCLGVSLGLVGCNGTDDMTGDNTNDTGYDYATDGYGTNGDFGINEDRNFGMEGESLSNQINGIFGRYGIDGNDTNTNSDNNISSNKRTTQNTDDLGFQYGYGDGLDTSLNTNYELGGNYNRNYTLGGNNNGAFTNNRFGFGMRGAENILGNGTRASNNYTNDNTLNNSLMS